MSLRQRYSRLVKRSEVDRHNIDFSNYPNNTLPDLSTDISTITGLETFEDEITVLNNAATQIQWQGNDYTDPIVNLISGWRSGLIWDTPWDSSDGFVVHVYTHPLDPTKQNGGPLVCFNAADNSHGIGAWAVTVLTWFELGDLGLEPFMFKYRDTCFVNFSHYLPSSSDGIWLSVWVKGDQCWLTVTTPQINNRRVAGPVTIDADLLASTLQGLQLDVGWRDATTKAPQVDSGVNRCVIRPYNGPDPIDYNPPIVTTGTFVKSTGALTVAVPDSSQIGDRLLLAVAGNVTPTVSSDWTLLDSGAITGHSQRVYYHDVTISSPFYNSTGATTSVTHTAGACAAGVARMRNFNQRVSYLSARVGDTVSDTSTTLTAVKTFGEHRTSLAVISAPANITITLPAGWTKTQTSGAQAVTLAFGVVEDWSNPGGGLALEQSSDAGLPMQVPQQAVTLSSAAISISTHFVIMPDPTLVSAW